MRLRSIGLPALLVLLPVWACQPVPVREGQMSIADVAVPRRETAGVNLVAIGVADADGRIVLGATGIRVARGGSSTIGLAGPGLVEGTVFLVAGTALSVRVVRFTTTSGGGGAELPAAVLSLTVPADAEPGIYSVLAIRGRELAVFTGAVEVA